MGRQPWVVYGLLKTSDARSPLVGSGSIVITLVGYTLLYGVLLVIGGRLFLSEIAHGPEARAGRHRRWSPGGPAAPRPGPGLLRAEANDARPQLPADALVPADRRAVDRLLHPRGLRLRRRHAAARARPRRDREAHDHPHDRPRVGRQRGVAADRGRRDLRGLPRLVREPLLGLLPRAVPDPRRADRPRRLVRVLGQGGLAALARHVGVDRRDRQLPRGAAVGRRLGGHRPRRADERPAQRDRVALGPAAPLRAARRPRDARRCSSRTARSS